MGSRDHPQGRAHPSGGNRPGVAVMQHAAPRREEAHSMVYQLLGQGAILRLYRSGEIARDSASTGPSTSDARIRSKARQGSPPGRTNAARRWPDRGLRRRGQLKPHPKQQPRRWPEPHARPSWRWLQPPRASAEAAETQRHGAGVADREVRGILQSNEGWRAASPKQGVCLLYRRQGGCTRGAIRCHPGGPGQNDADAASAALVRWHRWQLQRGRTAGRSSC